MKILHLSFFDNYGGAAKAAYRVLNCQLNSKMQSDMMVYSKFTKNKNVFLIKNKFSLYLNNFIVSLLNFLLVKIYKKQSVYSLNIIPSNLSKKINKSDYDIVNFHWINHEMISLNDISRIEKPIVWTIHDNWPFASIEHYVDINDKRFFDGYDKKNSSFLEKLIWKKKLKIFQNKISCVIAPSKWIENLAINSLIFKNIKVVNIPYSIDPKMFYVEDKINALKKLNIKDNLNEKFIISFGATSAYSEKRKGFKYVYKAIQKLNKEFSNIHFIVFGENSKILDGIENITNYSEIHDENKLRNIYNASDIFLSPSLKDNLPLTVMESLSCGTPVVAFNVGGMKDLIIHKKNGYLALEDNFDDFYVGIKLFLEINVKKKINYLEIMEYKKFMANFDPKVISNKYHKTYEETIHS